MNRVTRTMLALLTSSVLALTVAGAGAVGAAAYGSAAQWQIGLSFNCNNPSICGSQLGGFWGWAEFDNDGTADAQLTDCQHLQGGRAAGAHHVSVDVPAGGWYIGSNGDFFVTSEVDTITGRTGGPPVVITVASENMDTMIPASPGHYSSQTLFGSAAPPGANFEIQVVLIPGR